MYLKSLKTYVLIFVSVMCLSDCKRYPEGGYTFNALKHLSGVWKLKLYEVNGIDSTYLTQGANTIPNYIDNFAEFATVHSGKRVEIDLNNHYRNYSVSWGSIKTTIIGLEESSDLDSTGCTSYGPQMCQRDVFNPTNERHFSWIIDKLTKKELILTSLRTNSYKIWLTRGSYEIH